MAAAFTQALHQLLLQRTWESLRDVLALPKCVLGATHSVCNRQVGEVILQRLKAWDEGEREALWVEGRPPRGRGSGGSLGGRSAPAPTEVDKVARLADENFLAKVQALAEEGAFSKAVRHILSDSVHVVTGEVLAQLKALHPEAPPSHLSAEGGLQHPPPVPLSVGSPVVTGTVLREGRAAAAKKQRLYAVIRSFPVASAPGPSALRPGHLQEMLLENASGACVEELLRASPFIQVAQGGGAAPGGS